MTSTTGIQEISIQVDNFISRGMLEETLTHDEVKNFRSQEVIEVTVHGQTTEKLSIEGLEEKFLKDTGGTRITVPNNDILQHQYRAQFPLNVTSDDVFQELTELYTNIYNPQDTKIKQEEVTLDSELNALLEGRQSIHQATNKITTQFEDIVILEKPNNALKAKMKREIQEALEQGTDNRKTTILTTLRNILKDGAEREVLFKNKMAKAKWGALNNRRGQLGENKTAAAVNQVLEDYQGMSVVGLKTHTHLYDILDKLNIQLTHSNTRNPVTGKIVTTNEVEHDNISSWLEEDALVLNMIQVKTTETKPWAPALSQARREKAAVNHVKQGLLQIEKDFRTFHELFPDFLESAMKMIRLYSKKHHMHTEVCFQVSILCFFA